MITDTTTTKRKSKFLYRKAALSKIQITVKTIVNSLDNYVHKNNNELHEKYINHISYNNTIIIKQYVILKKGQFITKGK